MSEGTCSVEGCEVEPYPGYTLCTPHYREQLKAKRAEQASCSVDGCEQPLFSLHLCSEHHREEVRSAPVRLCSEVGCERQHYARNWCEKHYIKNFLESAEQQALKAECSVAGCDRKVKSRGMCMKHYQRARRKGEIVVGGARRDGIKIEE